MERPALKNVLSDSTGKDRRVFIIYAGGTIGMKKTTQGHYIPVANYLRELVEQMPEFKDDRMPKYDIKEFSPLLDSSDMDAGDWKAIAKDIASHYDDYDGFVVIHGTDTMAYTASALSFMLENLGKPVILTGSQIPLSEIRNDGRYNLISSVVLAGNFDIPEVCIFFDEHLLRGNRSKKIDIWGLRAFDSLNFPPLGIVGIEVNLNADLILPTPSVPFRCSETMCEEILTIRMFPGFSPKFLVDMVDHTSAKAIVFEVFGSGNMPGRKPDYLLALKKFIDRGIVVVVLSQVSKGAVNLGQYFNGQGLKQIGVISAFDITIEAAVTKLMYLFGKGLSPDEVKQKMIVTLAGEFTIPDKIEDPNATFKKYGTYGVMSFRPKASGLSKSSTALLSDLNRNSDSHPYASIKHTQTSGF